MDGATFLEKFVVFLSKIGICQCKYFSVMHYLQILGAIIPVNKHLEDRFTSIVNEVKLSCTIFSEKISSICQ